MTDSASDTIELTYAYRPSVLGATWTFRLTPTGINWDAGRRHGYVAYSDVTRVRLSFRPATLQSYRFLAEVWARDGTKLRIVSSSWKSMVEQTRLDASYRQFIGELHRRLAASGAPIVFVRGANPAIYWAGVALFAATSLALAALTARSLQAGATSAAILIVCFLAAFLWQAGVYFRRNRPGRYGPEAMPPEQLPSGS